MLYDCKNSGKINQMERQGVAMRYCACLDLKASGDNNWFTGPQCAFATNVVESCPASVDGPEDSVVTNEAEATAVATDILETQSIDPNKLS